VMIRLGHVVEDLAQARFLLIGGGTAEQRHWIERLWWPWGTSPAHQVICSDPLTIAVAKLAINATLSSRIAWANDVAERAISFGANPYDVIRALGADPRIGSSHMRWGHPPGGPCIPRDMEVWCRVKGLGLAEVIRGSHEVQGKQFIGRLIKEIQSIAPKNLDSLGLRLLEALQGMGIGAEIYDPAMEYLPAECLIGVPLPRDGDVVRMIERADVVVIATHWPEFNALNIQGKPVIRAYWSR